MRLLNGEGIGAPQPQYPQPPQTFLSPPQVSSVPAPQPPPPPGTPLRTSLYLQASMPSPSMALSRVREPSLIEIMAEEARHT
jgi:hypothetical protein